MESPKDAEYVVAKAIRDGVVEATIDHSGKFMQSSEGTKLYSTTAPYEQFHKRIEFCLNIRNDAVRAMRFPDQAEQPDVLKKEETDDKKKKGAAVNPATEDVDESAALDELDDEEE